MTEHDEAPEAPDFDCVIVGGGIAGLVVARQLVLAGLRVALFEASERLGGKTAQLELDGITIDAGAESFATRGNTVADYASRLGLGEDVVSPNPDGAWLYTDAGSALPLPKAGMLGIPTVPLAREVIDAIGLPAALRAQLDALIPGFYGSKEPMLGGFVSKRYGRKVVDLLVAPVTLGVHSRHPDELPLDTVAPGLRAALKSEESLASALRSLQASAPAGTAVQGLRGGVARLGSVLAADLDRFGVPVRLETPVKTVEAGSVTLADERVITAHRVVLACNDAGLTGRAPQQEHGQVDDIVLACLVVASAALDSAPRGTGVLVAPGAPGVTAKALTHATAKWDWLREAAGAGRHVIRLSYAASKVDDSSLRATAVADASTLLGVSIGDDEVLAFERVDWRQPRIERRSAPEGVDVVGEAVAGTGLAAVIRQASSVAEEIALELAPDF